MRETFPSSVQCWQLLSKKNTTLKVGRWHLRLIYVRSSLRIMEVACGESMRDKNNSLNMFRLVKRSRGNIVFHVIHFFFSILAQLRYNNYVLKLAICCLSADPSQFSCSVLATKPKLGGSVSRRASS